MLAAPSFPIGTINKLVINVMHGELHHRQVLQQSADAGSIMAPSQLIAGMGNISNPPT